MTERRLTMSESILHFTTNHNDKMNGLASLSTSPLCNPLCGLRANNPEMICSHCYSITMQKRFSNLSKCLERNTDILTSRMLSDEEIPFLISETGLFRFEAFGDLNNEIQVVNYFKIADANKHMNCALWTKNPWLIERAMKKYGVKKPSNLIIIGSSYFVNKSMADFFRRYDFIDYVFTVYTKKFAEENNITINCGGRSCKSCMACYFGTHANYEINELLK